MAKIKIIVLALLIPWQLVAQQTRGLPDNRLGQLVRAIGEPNQELSSEAIIGVWVYSEGFWSEQIQFFENGKFKANKSGCFGKWGRMRGSWEINGGDLNLSNGSHSEAVFPIFKTDKLYLLTSGQIAELQVLIDDLSRAGNLTNDDIETLVLNRSLTKTQ